jgi:hypothetical protein
VPGFAAEMRQVDPRDRVVGCDAEHRAGRHLHQELARPEHRQRAEQAARVEFPVGGHGAGLDRRARPVHGLVTAGGVTRAPEATI